MFSHDHVARFIQYNFEPVWQSVREVPIVRIDFGNGTIVTRTLHGNIATYVCDCNGNVCDVLPGIYTPNVYLKRLEELLRLARFLSNEGIDNKGRVVILRGFHQRVLELAETRGGVPVRTAARSFTDVTKRIAIERPTELLVGATTEEMTEAAKAVASGEVRLPGDLSSWEFLVKDTKANETIRRKQIHRKLADMGLVKPQELQRWLYKEVLATDLEDPYLGLGKLLFGSYPFAAEDEQR